MIFEITFIIASLFQTYIYIICLVYVFTGKRQNQKEFLEVVLSFLR